MSKASVNCQHIIASFNTTFYLCQTPKYLRMYYKDGCANNVQKSSPLFLISVSRENNGTVGYGISSYSKFR